jgi:hypothetical protein
MSGSYGGEYEDDCLLRYFAVQSGRSLPTFQRCLPPPLDTQMQPKSKYFSTCDNK